MNRQLQGENADLRGLLEGCKSDGTAEASDEENSEDRKSRCTGNCEARADADRLKAELTDTHASLEQQINEYGELYERATKLQQQLAQSTWAQKQLRRELDQSNAALEEQRREVKALQARLSTSDANLGAAKKRAKELEAKVTQHEIYLQVLQGRVKTLESKLYECKAAKEAQDSEMRTVREQLSSSKAELCNYEERMEALEEQLEEREDDLRHRSRQLAEVKHQYSAKIAESDQTVKVLRQELEVMKRKCERYNVMSSREGQAHTTSAPSPAVQPADLSQDSRRADSSGHEVAGSRVKCPDDMSWTELLEFTRCHPCFSMANPRAPSGLPHSFRELFARGSSVLSCPNRIFFPGPEKIIWFLAPVAQCKSAQDTLTFGDPIKDLSRMVGYTKEVFYHDYAGISYLGTFIGVSVDTLSQREYAALSKTMRDAIVKHTFPSKEAFHAASKTAIDRVRNEYMTGNARAQYLELRFKRFNRSLYEGLKEYASSSGIAPSSELLKRLSPADVDPRLDAAKRVRLSDL